MNSVLSAELILKSKTGLHLNKTSDPITQENIEKYKPPDELLESVVGHFNTYGFTVDKGDITISITGEKELFEKVFDTKLIVEHDQEQIARISWQGFPKIPEKVKDSVLDVVFPQPPEFFN